MTPPDDFERILRAIRFGFVAIILGLAYPNIHCALRLSKLKLVFQDMFFDRNMPTLLGFIITIRFVLIASSILVPLLGLVSLSWRNLPRSFYFVGWLVIISLTQLALLWNAFAGGLGALVTGVGQTRP